MFRSEPWALPRWEGSAARVEGLYDFLVSLHDEVEKLLPHSYLERSVRSSGSGISKMKQGHGSVDAGEVVGRLPIQVPSLAKQVDPARLSLPEGRPEFDAGPLLQEPHCSKTPSAWPENLAWPWIDLLEFEFTLRKSKR